MFDMDKVWRCECGDADFISIHGFEEFKHNDTPEVESQFWDLEITGYFGQSWRERLKGIWKLITGDRYASACIVLDEKTTREIHETLGGILRKWEAKSS